MSEFLNENTNTSSSSAAAADGDGSVKKDRKRQAVAVIVIGMAGAGKTTLMHRINLEMIEKGKKGYYINLDPAVRDVPFAANIDIRDTVNYKEVMKQYNLGPNGGILTSLNLFATRFDQVVGILEKRQEDLDYIFIDTPGQIESFTWSAGGQIILDLLASTLPTIILYVVDTPRCQSPTTFMSNMLYASSVLYKSELPMIVVFNKNDLVNSNFAESWMQDFEAYQDALDNNNVNTANKNPYHQQDDYMISLNRSLSLVMDEFYNNIRRVGVSAATAEGIDKLFDEIEAGKQEFDDVYLPELMRRISLRTANDQKRQQEHMTRLQQDLQESKGDKLVVDGAPSQQGRPTF